MKFSASGTRSPDTPVTLDNFRDRLTRRLGNVSFGTFDCTPDASDRSTTICIGNPRLKEVGANLIVRGLASSRAVTHVGVMITNPEMISPTCLQTNPADRNSSESSSCGLQMSA